MNLEHLTLCSSAEWAEAVQRCWWISVRCGVRVDVSTSPGGTGAGGI
jgi:hypothetical protein